MAKRNPASRKKGSGLTAEKTSQGRASGKNVQGKAGAVAKRSKALAKPVKAGKVSGAKKAAGKTASAKKAVKKLTKKAAGKTASVKKAGKTASVKKAAKKLTKKAAESPPRVKKTAGRAAGVKKGQKARGNSEGRTVSQQGVEVGSRAPKFSLRDQSGNLVSSRSLARTTYVLYFYPKDSTPGCTQEACDFRDEHAAFRKAGVQVFGVSPDSETSHQRFAKKHELPFPLLCDPDKELAQAYGVWALKKNYGREYWGIVRSTFLIGPDGKVRGAWRNVKVKGHVESVLAAARGGES